MKFSVCSTSCQSWAKPTLDDGSSADFICTICWVASLTFLLILQAIVQPQLLCFILCFMVNTGTVSSCQYDIQSAKNYTI